MGTNMKKVIVINYTGRKGAGPINAIEMAKGMLDNHKDVIAIVSEYCSNLDDWKKLELERLIIIKTYENVLTLINNTILFLFKKNEVIRNLGTEYEIAYIYCPMVTYWSRFINQKIGKKYKTCVVIHDPIPHSGDKIKKIVCAAFGQERLYKNASVIVTHSRKFIKFIEEKYNKKDKVCYIPLGRHDFYKKYSCNIRYKGYKKDAVNFLFFGRIEPYKGINILLEAYRKLKSEVDHVTLTIAGAGKHFNIKENDINLDINIENRWIEDDEVESFFCGENVVLILPYLDATQSGPVLIAMEYDVPVIGTKTGGLEEQIQEGKTGLLVEAGNVEQLMKAMLEIANNIELREELKSGIKEYRESLNWNKLAGTIDDFMEI